MAVSGYTQEQLAGLRDAAAKGVTSLEYNGEKVTYRSLDEMLRLIAVIERSLASATPRTHFPTFRKG
jgi:hypothetical protein